MVSQLFIGRQILSFWGNYSFEYSGDFFASRSFFEHGFRTSNLNYIFIRHAIIGGYNDIYSCIPCALAFVAVPSIDDLAARDFWI